MTPHYGKWYRGEGLPDDTESPVPIGFLSIGPGSCFEAALVARNDAGARHLDGIVEDLRRGLDELGLGAKTAAGYGVFSVQLASQVSGHTTQLAPAEERPLTRTRGSLARDIEEEIEALKRHEVKGRIQALSDKIWKCPDEDERKRLVKVLRDKLSSLGIKGKELRELEQRFLSPGRSSS